MKFKQFNCDIYLTLLFTKSESKKDYYVPDKEISDPWIEMFETLEPISVDVEQANEKSSDAVSNRWPMTCP